MSDLQTPSLLDEELTTIGEILVALEGFDKPTRKRILDYVSSRLELPTSSPQPAQAANGQPQYTTSQQTTYEFDSLAELISATNPDLQREKVLIAAYWIQVCKDQSDGFGTKDVKKALIDIGHNIGNPTQTLKNLTEGKDAHIFRVKRDGKGKKAPIIFKISAAGQKAVEEMINQQG